MKTLPRSYKKTIDWLYSKGDNCSGYQKLLRAYMLMGWSKRELLKLKVNKLI